MNVSHFFNSFRRLNQQNKKINLEFLFWNIFIIDEKLVFLLE